MIQSGSTPAVDIVTVTYHSADRLATYLEGLHALDYPADRVRILVVDNASKDETRPLLRAALPGLRFRSKLIESDRNVGFGAACNRAVALGSAPYVLFLNPDTRMEPDMLRRMVERAERSQGIGIVDATQTPVELRKWRDPLSSDTDWCSGAAMLARRDVFLEVGGFDTFFFLYAEDVDLSWRVWLGGWRCVNEPGARFRHDTGPEGTGAKPTEEYYSTRYSFSMRAIYGTPRDVLSHVVRGLRYLVSPKTNPNVRKGVAHGLATLIAGAPHLIRRRWQAQGALRSRPDRDRFVFSEWYYGRWRPAEPQS